MTDRSHQDQVITCVACAVLTVSDTRTEETDISGTLIRDRLAATGHQVCSYRILPDEPRQVREHVMALTADGLCHAALVNGGTGLAARDTTYEAIAGLLEKRLDGFGELFRMLSFEQIGPAAMLSRSLAGIRGRMAIFSIPGSPDAVRLAMDRLILPTLGHIAWLLNSSTVHTDNSNPSASQLGA